MGGGLLIDLRGCAGDLTHALFSGQSQSIRDNVMALFGAIRAWNCSVANLASTGRISAMWNRIPIERCPGQVGVCYPLDCSPRLSGNIGLTLTQSRPRDERAHVAAWQALAQQKADHP